MRYFFDTEFHEQAEGQMLALMSIGIVAEDGREFYAVHEYACIVVNPWLQENVVKRLQPKRYPKYRSDTYERMRADLAAFIGDDPAPEFWAYYGAHDWVALCNLMGGMMSLPAGWPWLVRDLRIELDRVGKADVKDDGRDDEHNALADARWVRDAWTKHIAPPTPRSEERR